MADGNIVYQGLANEAPAYFSKLDFKFSKFSSPADIFMKVLSVNYPKQKEDSEKLDRIILSYEKKFKDRIINEIEKSKIPDFDLLSKKRYQASLCK